MNAESPLRADREPQVVEVAGHKVAIAYDPDGEAWYVQASSVAGLSGQADTLDDLLDELPAMIRQATLP